MVDLRKAFHEIEYTWNVVPSNYLHVLRGFCFDPLTVDLNLTPSSENIDADKIERDAEEVKR